MNFTFHSSYVKYKFAFLPPHLSPPMIAILPASIEAYLKDAKFSTTEVLVIRKLLEEDALTLRELATKTGKSTGVLDQALKKLLGKGIVNKQAINAGFKYTMGSLKPILEWMEKDMKQKYEMLERRHQNFEAFVESLAVDKGRPEMQYFDGEEGIKRAYIKLLDSKVELLCYWPHECNWEEHPMRDFYVQYFRERHRRNIFSRVITHDTLFGRRFQTRDPFEYRKTILVPEGDFPIPFEKVIAGDLVACFNHKQKQACFIKYPEFTHAERMLFENHWKEAQRKQQMPSTIELEEAAELTGEELQLQSPEIELRTRVFSQLRDFFLSKASIVSFGVFLVLAGAITFGLYKQNEHLNLQRMREKVESIAATAALQFDAKDLDTLQVEQDWRKPEWAKVVRLLEGVRKNNKDLMYAYIIRQSKDDPNGLEFVADSHSLNPYANVDDDPTNDVDVHLGNDPTDVDNGATSTGANYLQWPGQQYPNPPQEAIAALSNDGALSNQDFYSDQWGTMITGYAPVKDASGRIAGVVAVDLAVGKLQQLQKESFFILYYLLGFFLIFAAIRFVVIHRSLFNEVWGLMGVRKFCLGLVACFAIAFFLTFAMYKHTLGIIQSNLSDKLMSIAITAASEFDYKDLSQLRFAEDMEKDAYQRVFKRLNTIRERNPDIRYAYIMRKIDSEMSEFVADADSNFDLPFAHDQNNDGKIDEWEEQAAPGIRYSSDSEDFHLGFSKPGFDADFVTDQWGVLLSGYAPIVSDSGESYLVGLDIDASKLHENLNLKFKPWIWFFGTLLLLAVVALVFNYIKPKTP